MKVLYLLPVLLIAAGCPKHSHHHSHDYVKHKHKKHKSHKERVIPVVHVEVPLAPEKEGKKKPDLPKLREFDYDPAGPYSPDINPNAPAVGAAPDAGAGAAFAGGGAAAPAPSGDSSQPGSSSTSGWFW